MDASLYDQFYQIEASHWWFVARREIILDHIRRYAPSEKDNAILDVGCGTGIMLKHLRSFGCVQGLDFSAEAVNYSNLRLGDNSVVKLGSLVEGAPFKNDSFNVVTLLDVIEHIDDDQRAVRTVWNLLQDGGILICTVPAYPFLWSGHDVLNHHKRRYRMEELREKILASRFKIEKISYFNTLLSPFVFWARLAVSSKKRMEPKSDFKMYPDWLNNMLKNVFLLEKNLLRHVNFPFGVSLICIARKGAG